jgi:energy-coupling factor transport system permease protein
MSVLAPLAPSTHGPLARRNPVAKLALAAIVLVGAFAGGGPALPATLLAIELALLPFSGVRAGTLVRRSWPLVLSVAGVALANLLVVDTGDPRPLLSAGPLDVTVGTAVATATVCLRLLAITLPGIVVLATTDPLDLADALVQRLRVPARFAYGALAALRLLPLLSVDWQQIARARRARGLDAGRSPLAAGRLFASQVFAVLVGAIRRGVRLATAMEARGFDGSTPRSVARPQPMRAGDWVLVLGTLLVVGAVVLATRG